MATDKHYTRLSSSTGSFDAMLAKFGVVTVMDAKIFEYNEEKIKGQTAYQIYQDFSKQTPVCSLDTLKIANVTIDGPTKTITGGKYNNTLLKYGKTARLEMQDALGNAEAIDALCGGLVERAGETDPKTKIGLHVGSDFSTPKTIIGDSFFLDENGQQVKVGIIFYQFNPDSLFNLTQDAEGDATVFDMNGDLLTTEIMVGKEDGEPVSHGVFYSIVDPEHVDTQA